MSGKADLIHERNRNMKIIRIVLYILFFPYIIYLDWKKEEAFKNADWEKLISSLRSSQRFRGLTPRDLFLLGYAHSKLGRFKEAKRFMEFMQTPLENKDEEACRYCTHAWILYKLGKVDQSKAVLSQAMSESWPSYRIEWAKDFLDSMAKAEFLADDIFHPRLQIH